MNEPDDPHNADDMSSGSDRPRRQIGRRTDPGPEAGTSVATHDDTTSQIEVHAEDVDPREDEFAERQVSALFGLAILATLLFLVAYFGISIHRNLGQTSNLALGGSMAVAMLALGGGMIVWAKKLLPHEKAVQERHAFHSTPEEEAESENTFLAGVNDLGLGKRKILRRTLMGALALFPLPFVVMLRDLGPLPGTSLNQTGWKAGLRLVDLDTRLPVKLGDLSIGGIQTVMPEGFINVNDLALAPTILIRFAPGQILSAKEANWGVEDHVAYSKICTHAGCPISLYEQQTHHLLCPCHQSTFDMARDAKVIFGPAARPLPQLQIGVDDAGYFYAKAPYDQPVGPSFWERR
jgi:ubiquinol-cytochrome c reductase iron-sulfur subunit